MSISVSVRDHNGARWVDADCDQCDRPVRLLTLEEWVRAAHQGHCVPFNDGAVLELVFYHFHYIIVKLDRRAFQRRKRDVFSFVDLGFTDLYLFADVHVSVLPDKTVYTNAFVAAAFLAPIAIATVVRLP